MISSLSPLCSVSPLSLFPFPFPLLSPFSPPFLSPPLFSPPPPPLSLLFLYSLLLSLFRPLSLLLFPLLRSLLSLSLSPPLSLHLFVPRHLRLTALSLLAPILAFGQLQEED